MNNTTNPRSILFVAANPKRTQALRLHEEERENKEGLRLAGYGKVPINSTGATRPRDIQQALLDFKPQIVHFSGHGAGQDGLVFEDSIGQDRLVSSEALARLFKLFSGCGLECIVLNACYSQFQAEAIAQHINKENMLCDDNTNECRVLDSLWEAQQNLEEKLQSYSNLQSG